MAEELKKDEVKQIWKDINRKIQRTDGEDEVTGEKNYDMLSPDDIPLMLKGGDDVFNSLGGLTTNRIIGMLDSIEKDKILRTQRYKRLEFAQSYPEIEGALTIYADETMTEDSDGNVLHIIHPKEEVKQCVENMFERIGIYDKGWQIVYNLCGFGDDFYEVVVSQSGYFILKILPIPKEQIERVEKNGVLIGFKASKNTQDPREGFYSYKIKSLTKDSEEDEAIFPWRILHFRIPSSKYGVYGKSIIDSILAPIEQLKLMEKAMLIARVTRAAERRIFNVDVGNLMGEKAIKYAYDAVNYGKKKKKLDLMNTDLNRPDVVQDVFGTIEDIVIPKRQGSDGNSIDTLPQANNLGDIADVEFIRDKIFPPLGIPRQYLFDDTFANANLNLSSKSVPFSKRIKRIQRFFLYQMYKLAIIELKLQGFSNKDINDLIILMNNPSTIADKEQIEIETQRWGLIGNMKANNSEGVFYPDYLIYRDILKLNDDEIVELLKLSQLQAAGENIFNFMEPEERPEGAEDLQSQPNTGAGGGGGAGGGFEPTGGGEMPAEGGEVPPATGEELPAEVEAQLGPPPPAENAEFIQKNTNTYIEEIIDKAILNTKVSLEILESTDDKQYEVALNKKRQLINKLNMAKKQMVEHNEQYFNTIEKIKTIKTKYEKKKNNIFEMMHNGELGQLDMSINTVYNEGVKPAITKKIKKK